MSADVTPGVWAGHRRMKCWRCGAEGESTGDRDRAYREAEQHECPPAAPKPAPEIRRPVLRYYGGKWRWAPWIIQHLPPHVSYVEPFAGAASVLLQKRPSPIEVYNDLDGRVVNFFRVLRDHPDALRRSLELTPYARAELAACAEPSDDPIEDARRYFVRSWLGRGAHERTTRGWRFEKRLHHRRELTVVHGTALDQVYDVARRFRDVQIECSPALDVIARFDTPDTLFYCDPPYVKSTRSRHWRGDGYRDDMEDEDHRAFATALSSVEGMAVVSGYQSALYDEIFAGWTVLKKTAHHQQNFPNSPRGPVTEVLWISPKATERRAQRPLLLGEEVAAG